MKKKLQYCKTKLFQEKKKIQLVNNVELEKHNILKSSIQKNDILK